MRLECMVFDPLDDGHCTQLLPSIVAHTCHFSV